MKIKKKIIKKKKRPVHRGVADALEPREPHGAIGIAEILKRLASVQPSTPGQWSARCPAHADSKPSLSICENEDGRVLLYCQSGCTTESVLAAMKLNFSNLAPAKQPQGLENSSGGRVMRQPPQIPVARPPMERSKLSSATATDWTREAEFYIRRMSDERLNGLAGYLGVTPESLRALRVGHTTLAEPGKYTFPEHDGIGNVIGISTRSPTGEKGFIPGGNRGLIISPNLMASDQPIFIVEGASDVAALLSAGLTGVGRPSCSGGAEHLANLLAAIPREREIIVVAEVDPQPDGKWPGRDGAMRVAQDLAERLHRLISVACPPGMAKDVRKWLTSEEVC